MDLGLLLLRLVLGALLVGHAAQKLWGAFGGGGIAGTGAFFDSIGYRPGRKMVVLAGVSELVASALLILGLLTPLGGAIVVGTLTVASSPNWAKGVWATKGGFELPMVYAFLGAVLALTGPGAISLDHALDLDRHWSVRVGIGAIALGLVAAAPLIVRARRTLLTEQRDVDAARA